MALLFADGFEDGSSAWTIVSATIGAARFGNGLVSTNTSGVADTGFPITVGPIIFGFAIKPTAAGLFCAFMETASSLIQVGLQRGAGGEITVFRASTSSPLGTTAINVLPAGAWSYVETKVTYSDTTGIVVLRVNGVEVLNLSGQDTKFGGTGINQLRIGYAGGSATAVYDDVYICDGTGTVNNNFLGEIMVEHLRPIADDTSQWLGSDGNSVNNFDLVDEAGTYNGTDYVASSIVGQRDLYTVGSSTRPVGSPVVGVIATAIGMKSDAGTRTIKLNVKEGSGGTVRQSSELGLPTTFGELRAVFERKGDGTQFSVADVNALRVGMEIAT